MVVLRRLSARRADALRHGLTLLPIVPPQGAIQTEQSRTEHLPYTRGVRTAGARGNAMSLTGQYGMLRVVTSIGLCGTFIYIFIPQLRDKGR
jgi:hypothetical protein